MSGDLHSRFHPFPLHPREIICENGSLANEQGQQLRRDSRSVI